METAENWKDSYTITKNGIIYTQEQHHVPGVHTLAHYIMKDSIPSLGWHYHENSFEIYCFHKRSLFFQHRHIHLPFFRRRRIYQLPQ